MHIPEFLAYLSTEKRYSPHTTLAYKTDLHELADYLLETYEVNSPEQITTSMLRSYVVERMEGGLRAKSVNRKISSIKAYIRFLRKTNVLSTNPAATLKSLKTPKTLVSAVGEQEMEKLFTDDFFEDTPEGIRARAILEVLYATGIRRSELIELTIGNIDVSRKTLRVLGKRNKVRIVPLTEAALTSVNTYLHVRPTNSDCEALFLTDRGKKLPPTFVYTTVKRYLSYVSSLQKKSPHVLRHTYATHLLNNGAEMNDIKELLGHANLSATQVYTHNSFEQLKSVYNQSHPREAQNE